MKERPIIFSAPMVRAILAGTKTQTRRALRGFCPPNRPEYDSESGRLEWFNGDEVVCGMRCPYGKPGDRLWVRETFFAWGRWETRFSAKKGRDEWHFIDMTLECGKAYVHAASGAPHDFKKGNQRSDITPAWWKRPAIHMPSAASRITLEVTGVRVERLQDISEADAVAEGIAKPAGSQFWHADPHGSSLPGETPQWAYRNLWESINGPGSWGANPWIWCVSFRRIDAATQDQLAA